MPYTVSIKPGQGPPKFAGFYAAEILLLGAQIWGDPVGEQGEETCERDGGVGIAQEFEIDTVAVIDDGEEITDAVDGDHEEDADDAWAGVIEE